MGSCLMYVRTPVGYRLQDPLYSIHPTNSQAPPGCLLCSLCILSGVATPYCDFRGDCFQAVYFSLWRVTFRAGGVRGIEKSNNKPVSRESDDIELLLKFPCKLELLGVLGT